MSDIVKELELYKAYFDARMEWLEENGAMERMGLEFGTIDEDVVGRVAQANYRVETARMAVQQYRRSVYERAIGASVLDQTGISDAMRGVQYAIYGATYDDKYLNAIGIDPAADYAKPSILQEVIWWIQLKWFRRRDWWDKMRRRGRYTVTHSGSSSEKAVFTRNDIL